MSDQSLRDAASREMIRRRLDANLLVEAGAGSGKTESLAGRMVETIAEGLCRVERIAAVTFTKKAASELRGRFRLELERQLAQEADAVRRDRLLMAVSGMERMFAGTIHSFCAHLLRERPVEAGLAPGFREIEQAEDAITRRRMWREYIDRAQNARAPELLALTAVEVSPSDLDDAFAAVCAYPDVEFPPGEGAVPDAAAAWIELDRFWSDLQALCPPISDDSKCPVQGLMRQFEPRYRNADRTRVPVLARLLALWEKDKKITQKWWSGQGKKAEVLIGEFQGQVVSPFMSKWREHVYCVAMKLLIGGRDWAAGERRRAALLNFTDLLLFTSRLVRQNRAVREALQRKYQRIFVDEFQDTDPMQAEVLFLLASEPGVDLHWTETPLRPGALFLVGDPKQSIFRFRRADIEIYQQAKLRINRASGQTVPLTTCFRSGPAICDWANHVFSNLFPREATTQQPGFEHLDPKGSDEKQAAGAVRLTHDSSVAQKDLPAADAEAIARYIRSEVGSTKRTWGDFLILTRRKKGRLGLYTQALEEAGVPYEVSGSGSLLESEYVQAMFALLFVLTHPDDGIAVVGVLRGPCFGLSDPELYEHRKGGGPLLLSVPVVPDAPGPVASAIRTLQNWRAITRRMPAGAAAGLILEQSGLLVKAAASSTGGGEAGKLVYALDRLRGTCETGMTLGDALLVLEEGSEDDESDSPILEPGRRDVVRIMNLHKAKGLEGKVVVLADPLAGVEPRADMRIIREGEVARGYIPITRAKGEYQREILGLPPGWAQHERDELDFIRAEETRLLYVAATRARGTLVVSEWQGNARGRVTRPWLPLAAFLLDRPSLEISESVPEAVAPLPDLSEQSRQAAERDREARRANMTAPCFKTLAISSLASRAAEGTSGGIEEPSGRDWGTLIHALLEYAVLHLDCTREDLERAARWHLAGSTALEQHVNAALATIEKVCVSELWSRVQSAHQRLTEVPIGGPWDEQVPTGVIAKGVMDLVLRMSDGWQIIDYKTDAATIDQLIVAYGEQLRAYTSLWEKASGEPVVFAGLYSVREHQLSVDVRGQSCAGSV